MNRILDINNGIPYFTNDSDQIFAWYAVYDDNVIILEKSNFSSVSFNDIPKHSLKYFGLFGCGMHLTCNFYNKSLSVYSTYNENEFLYECKYTLDKGDGSNVLLPFQFKGFIYDAPVRGVCKENFLINSFYLGWIEDVIVQDKKFTNKVYFVIDILKHPTSVGLIYKLIPSDNVYPQNNNYRLTISDNSNSIINDIQKSTSNVRNVYLNPSLKYKTIFRLNKKDSLGKR